MSECENVKCLNCDAENILKNGLCSKCDIEEECSELEEEFILSLEKSPKQEMKVHGAGLKKNLGRGQAKIAKVKPVKVKVAYKKR